jgi:hypothetical protein
MKGLDPMERSVLGSLLRGEPKSLHRTFDEPVRASYRLVERGLCVWVAVSDEVEGLAFECCPTKLGAEVFAWDRMARGEAA